MPHPVLVSGALLTALNFLDFFEISVQRLIASLANKLAHAFQTRQDWQQFYQPCLSLSVPLLQCREPTQRGRQMQETVICAFARALERALSLLGGGIQAPSA